MREMGSMALVEKRNAQQQRPGGCVGIFIQLLDWNRRLAKKKLFSRKLLPSVHAVKRVSKKFAGDEKMPASKLKLIADENRGGFPSLKKPDSKTLSSTTDDVGSGMRTPGLVARLMGLESMPAVNQEKPRKAMDSELHYDQKESFGFSRLDQDLCTEIGGNGKLDLRPQKIQKTGGFLERRPANAARFSSDAFRLNKGMLGSSKKQHYKLPTPVKSPRTLSRRSTTRLMEAATKILDPGSQSRNCALTYIGSSRANAIGVLNPTSFRDSLVGSCRSCGSFVEVSELRLAAKEPMATECCSSISDLSNASFSDAGSEEIRIKPQNNDSAKGHMKNRTTDFMERKYTMIKDQDQRKPREDLASKSGPKPNNLRQNPLPRVKERVVSEAKVNSRQYRGRYPNELNEAKDFAHVNKNLSKSTGTRPASKVGNCHRMVGVERSSEEKHLVHKKRPNGSSQIENVGAANSRYPKERSTRSDCITRKVARCTSDYSSRNYIKSELRKRRDGDSDYGGKDNGVVSFTFSSPVRQVPSSLPVAEMKTYEDSHAHGIFDSVKLSADAMPGNLASHRSTTLRDDALSHLLEQKIRELTALNADDLAAGGASLGRSTASILEDLISALTIRDPISEKNAEDEYGSAIKSCRDTSSCDDNNTSQNQEVISRNSIKEEGRPGFSATSPACEKDQCSPVSVLGVSFSNEGHLAGSPNGSSGYRPEVRLGDSIGCKIQHQLELDNDLLDSATSKNVAKSNNKKDLLAMDKHLKMSSVPSLDARNLEIKLNDDIKVISDIKLLFEALTFDGSDGTPGSSVNSILHGMLENIARAFYTDPELSSCFSVSDGGSRIRSFIFDCMIECLHSRFGSFCKSGYKTWMRSHLWLSRDRLMTEIYKEIRSWHGLSGRVLDDMIEKEMNHMRSLRTECVPEAFDTGLEIQSELLQVLVDELVVDLCEC